MTQARSGCATLGLRREQDVPISETLALLQGVQLIVFAVTALAGLRLWLQHRSMPAAYLAAAFGTLAGALLLSRLVPSATGSGLSAFARDLVVVGLAAFPWLFALFAWSFERRIPRWLAGAGVAVLGLSVWALLLPPLPEDQGSRSTGQIVFVATFIAVWATLTLATAAKLWRAGGSQPLIRARMRLMAAGALVVTVALLLAGTATGQESTVVDLGIQVLVTGSALLFLAGFVPPRWLRMWWRRRATAHWQQMQLDLIAAATPGDVARAALPVTADVLGAGAVVVTGEGDVLAAVGLGDAEAGEIAARARDGGDALPREQWVPVSSAWLVVKATPYTPLFGRDERDLLAGFALQLRLALERAQLFDSNEQARRALEQARDETQAMMVGLAHDLRTPLLGISGYTSLLRDTEDSGERDQMLDRIDANSDHLGQLVDSLVELSRIGRTQTEREPVDLERTLDKVTARLASSYPDAVVRSTGLPSVLANPLAMEQLLENLLVNAAKHGGRDDITIRLTHHEGDGVVIDVIDDGRGIPAEEREAVFTPFQRGRDAAGNGSGVGLGLVRRIVEGHEGTITLLDRDDGAHFRLTLPSPDRAPVAAPGPA